jgi:hypothetical protein
MATPAACNRLQRTEPWLEIAIGRGALARPALEIADTASHGLAPRIDDFHPFTPSLNAHGVIAMLLSDATVPNCDILGRLLSGKVKLPLQWSNAPPGWLSY